MLLGNAVGTLNYMLGMLLPGLFGPVNVFGRVAGGKRSGLNPQGSSRRVYRYPILSEDL